MKTYTFVLLLGLVPLVLAESAMKRDKDTLMRALKEKFREHRNQKLSETKSAKSEHVQPKEPYVQSQNQRDKAASAIGLALLGVSKPTTKSKEEKNADEAEDTDDDEMPNKDDDNTNVELSTKHEGKNHAKSINKEKFDAEAYDSKNQIPDRFAKQEVEGDSKKVRNNFQKNAQNMQVLHANLGKKPDAKRIKDEDETDNKNKEDKKVDEARREYEMTGKDNKEKDDTKSNKDSENKYSKNPARALNSTAKGIDDSVKSLKDEDLEIVNVGQLKKLLATSVENLGKAGKAIQNLLHYDKAKRAQHRQKHVTPQPKQSYTQQAHGAYPEPTTCSGQCDNLCAPACRDPCCRFPPSLNSGYNQVPAMEALGSYQQGFFNAYPPQTKLGGTQSMQNYQTPGQQCGQQCLTQSCAPSCSPSCCSQRNVSPPGVVPPGQVNAGCPFSCLSDCVAACHARCCVPGKKK